MYQLKNYYLSVMLYKRIVARKGYKNVKKILGVAYNSKLSHSSSFLPPWFSSSRPFSRLPVF